MHLSPFIAFSPSLGENCGFGGLCGALEKGRLLMPNSV